MGFFMPDPDPRAGYFASADLSGLNDSELRGPMPFGIPLLAFRAAFDAPLSAAADGSAPGALAQAQPDRKSQCSALCWAVTLGLPPGTSVGTFDQCMAHCEGKSFFPEFARLGIRSGGG
jgi:hypothetical protein